MSFLAIDRLACLSPARSSAQAGELNLTIGCQSMPKSQLSLLWILPLFVLVNTPIAARAIETTPLLPITLGKTYSGTLAPSPTNPQGEVCYKLEVKPNTRITLNVKTDGVGILKFAVYDKAKALRFFHNAVNNPQSGNSDNPGTSRFSFPILSDASQLCLTTTNPSNGQQYDLTVSGKPSRPNKPLVLRPAYVKNNLKAQVQSVPKPPTVKSPYCRCATTTDWRTILLCRDLANCQFKRLLAANDPNLYSGENYRSTNDRVCKSHPQSRWECLI